MVGTRIETAPAHSPGWRAGAGPLAILPRVLFRDERPWLAILVGWLLTIAGSTLIGWIVARISPDTCHRSQSQTKEGAAFATPLPLPS